MLIFDIETGPRPDDELRRMIPAFDPSTVDVPTGEFDPATVKLGTLKDKAKIDAKVDAARQAFEQAKADVPRILAEAERSYWQQQTAKAALSATMGRVLAVGVLGTGTGKHFILEADDDATEAIALAGFWRKYGQVRESGSQLCGFNIVGFDLPFMVRRSWLLGVDVPATVLDRSRRYFDPLFIDLLAVWKCGNYSESIKLDDLAKFFGLSGKPAGVTGADFARLVVEDHAAAIDYLVNDLRMTANCAARMGFV